MAKFKARARTVEMLGYQQIANVSTAFSELFKNAYDAYADEVTVDIFGIDNFLAIRDNGIGMTRKEFEDRWLVLGTESKFNSDTWKEIQPVGKSSRPPMGEKGIGRLAIALLGNQVLVMSRADREERDLIMCFIHWKLFELSGINLEDIEIPIKVIPKGKFPSIEDVKDICNELIRNIDELSSETNNRELSEIKQEIQNFKFAPDNYEKFFNFHLHDNLSLINGGFGTHFYIFPANKEICDEIRNERMEDNSHREFSKLLLGFTNRTFSNPPKPLIDTKFQYWKNENNFEDLIRPGEFFTEEDLEMADHRITGKVNEFGKFLGNVRIFNKQHENHEISKDNKENIATKCGPFALEFGYISGRASQSQMQPEDWTRMTQKLNMIGGIYVYRDNIRILPYGNSDFDWLKIEERRSLRASSYFFSHRRIFGAVILSREDNKYLVEKSGREGFRQDLAYRQLKEILEYIFVQLAADFFGKGEHSDYFWEQRKILDRMEKARKFGEKRSNTVRRSVKANISKQFEFLDSGQLETAVEEIKESACKSIFSANSINSPDKAVIFLQQEENKAYTELSDIRKNLQLDLPRGTGMTKELKEAIYDYNKQLQSIERDLIATTAVKISNSVNEVSNKLGLNINQNERLNNLLNLKLESSMEVFDREIEKLEKLIKSTSNSSIDKLHEIKEKLDSEMNKILNEASNKNLDANENMQFAQMRTKFEKIIYETFEKYNNFLINLQSFFSKLTNILDAEQDFSELEISEAMEEELLSLKDQIDSDSELVQMGLAVAIINHEFNSSIRSVRTALHELKPWAKANGDLAKLFHRIKQNFDHLDQYLGLFTPLHRRMYRYKITIKGSEIEKYLKALFKMRFSNLDIQFEVTDKFIQSKIESFPSTIYPVFVNVIDNAIYWLKGKKGEKRITLDAGKDCYLISNNGPGIKEHDYDLIFSQGFTRKPGGRGLGLHISKMVLKKEGMNIRAQNDPDGIGVTFVIGWEKNHE